MTYFEQPEHNLNSIAVLDMAVFGNIPAYTAMLAVSCGSPPSLAGTAGPQALEYLQTASH